MHEWLRVFARCCLCTGVQIRLSIRSRCWLGWRVYDHLYLCVVVVHGCVCLSYLNAFWRCMIVTMVCLWVHVC